MTDRLREAGVIVGHLNRALLDGTRDLRTIPGLLKRIIREEMWRQRIEPRSGRSLGPFETFAEFVERPPDEGGLGSSKKQLEGLCVDDVEARSELDRAYQNRPSVHAGNNIPGRPEGTSEAKGLRRLRKDRPDLHAEVLAGRLTAHGAMVKAGFRPKTFTVRPEPMSAARTLRKHMSSDDLALLAKLIAEA
jgi:hypothetical protein